MAKISIIIIVILYSFVVIYGLIEFIKLTRRLIQKRNNDYLWQMISFIALIMISVSGLYILLKYGGTALSIDPIYISIIYLLLAIFISIILKISNDTVNKAYQLAKLNKELKHAHDELKQEKSLVDKKVELRTKELTLQKKIVEGLLKQKDAFINQLSHDLRTPLTPLHTLLPMIKKEIKIKQTRKLIDVCIRNSDYLRHLILDTLELGKLGEHGVELNLKTISLKKFLDQILDEEKQFSSQIKVINKIDPNIKLKADDTKIREVFENIITNAVKYNDNKHKVLEVTSDTGAHVLELSFKDNGIGLEQKDLHVVFEEFYKVDPSRHQHSSSGLGLSIAHRIMSMHHGEIAAFSDGLGKGTVIKLAFPLYIK